MTEHAKELSAEPAKLMEQVLVKYTTAILEELRDQLNERNREIKRLHTVLATLITWLPQELGMQNIEVLLAQLNPPKDDSK